MKKVLFFSLLGFLAVLGSGCAFMSQIPDYYLAHSFGSLGFCCFGGIALIAGGYPVIFMED